MRRNSGLRVDGDGCFFFHDRPVENPRVQRLFHQHLAVREDGEVTLTVGSQWAYVACETVARFVEAISLEGGRLKARLRGGEQVVADAPQLGFAPDGRCYVWLSAGAPPAVLTRSAHQALVSLLVERSDRLVLPVTPAPSAVVTLACAPGPGTSWSG
ncbi:MAG: hypothetical protein QF464_15150 [Myxococcota bacterium]|nr:hypothetical protein [Myxococcota bacterium]